MKQPPPKRRIVLSLSQPLVAEDWRDAIRAWDPDIDVQIIGARNIERTGTAPEPEPVEVIAAIYGRDVAPLKASGTLSALCMNGGWHIRMTDAPRCCDCTPEDRYIVLEIPVSAEMMDKVLARIMPRATSGGG